MELLQRRKLCREFLNGYNERQHPQIISKVFEIGLLTLKKKFNKLLFSKEELDDIIKELSGKEYVEIVPLTHLKKLEKLPTPLRNLQNQENFNEHYNYNTENYDSELLKEKIIKNRKIYDKTLKNPNFTTQNSSIYPNWWWNNKEEEMQTPNNTNIIYNEENYINEDYNNNENYDENNNNEDYINKNDVGYNESNFQNYQERENDEIKNKNYSIKKLTMKSKPKEIDIYEVPELGSNIKKVNNVSFNNTKNNKLLNQKKSPNQIKKGQTQRVKSTKPRKINSMTKNKIEAHTNKMLNKVQNISQRKNNAKLLDIPKYKYNYVNGRILRIPEENKKFINLTMTEPNKY